MPHLEHLHEDAKVREADLLQLAQIASTYPSRQRFLTELTLDPPSATSDEAGAPLLDEDYPILSTIHSAKGQEWKLVFVLNCVDGCIPSDLGVGSTPEIEEERRLLYVAMTRAKDHLHLVVPHRFFVISNAATATATCTRCVRGSFRTRLLRISNSVHGRPSRRTQAQICQNYGEAGRHRREAKKHVALSHASMAHQRHFITYRNTRSELATSRGPRTCSDRSVVRGAVRPIRSVLEAAAT